MERQISRQFGSHYLVEYIGCKADTIRFVDQVRGVFLEAARISGATVLNDSFHQFEPEGVSGVIFIAESHFAIHTWPEDGYAGIDILTCGDMAPQRAIDFLKERFQARRVDQLVIARGY